MKDGLLHVSGKMESIRAFIRHLSHWYVAVQMSGCYSVTDTLTVTV